VLTSPLGRLLEDAARGRPPPADGSVALLPSPSGPCDVVMAFTAHSVVAATGVGEEEVRHRLDPDDLGAAHKAPFLSWLGARLGSTPGSLDVVLAAEALPGTPPLALEPSPAPDHPRVARAARYRLDVTAWHEPGSGAVLTIGRGVAGRNEVAFEVGRAERGAGRGRSLAAAARHLVPEGELVFAQVAPGNAASLRAVLAAGYVPLGAEVLFLRPATS
jgi:hypothetical protein